MRWLSVLLLAACAQPPPPSTAEAVEVQPTVEEPAVVEVVQPPTSYTAGDFAVDDCPLDRASKKDVNGDGKPNLFTVEEGGRMICRAMDLDMDGRPDVTVFYDEAGNKREKLTDFDGDGIVDVRNRYGPDGCVAEHDVDGDGRVDAKKPC